MTAFGRARGLAAIRSARATCRARQARLQRSLARDRDRRLGCGWLCLALLLLSQGCAGDGEAESCAALIPAHEAQVRALLAQTPPAEAGDVGGWWRREISVVAGQRTVELFSGLPRDLLSAGQRPVAFEIVAGAPGLGPLSLSIWADGEAITLAEDSAFSRNRVLPGRDWVVARVPSMQAAQPLRTHYRVTAEIDEPPTQALSLAVTVRVHPAGAVGSRTSQASPEGSGLSAVGLPLEILWAGASISEPALSCALAVAGSALQSAGIVPYAARIGQLPVAQEPTGGLQLDPVEGSRSPALGRLLRVGSTHTQSPLTLVFVSQLTVGSDPIVAAVGGIPGAFVAGTSQSGLVIAASEVAQDPVFAGETLAHELAHLLGLFHTTEAPVVAVTPATPTGSIQDGLADTRGCSAADDRDRNDRLSISECPDSDNLLFWQRQPGSRGLSPGQVEFMRTSPLLWGTPANLP